MQRPVLRFCVLAGISTALCATSIFASAEDSMPESTGPVISINPETGMFQQPDAEQMQKLRAETLAQLRQIMIDKGLLDSEARTVKNLPDGMIAVPLPLEHMNFIMMRKPDPAQKRQEEEWPVR